MAFPRRTLLPFLLGLPLPGAAAQGGPPSSLPAFRGLSALRQALLDAGTDRHAVLVATHPDDPYFGIAAVLRRRYGLRVTLVLATRGEGGQNAIGSEQGEALGRLRSRETLAAAERLGLEVRFLGLRDFGYCRTAAEALDQWRRRDPARLLESVLRELHPDLVLTPHHPGERHGQKKAVFHLLRRAASGFRSFRGVAEGERPDFEFDLDRLDPVLGETLQALAYAALEEHASQGPLRPMDEAVPAVLKLKAFPAGEGKGLLEGLPSLWDEKGRIDAWLEEAGFDLRTEELRRSLDEDLLRIPGRQEATSKALRLIPALQVLVAKASPGSGTRRRAARRLNRLVDVVLGGAGLRFDLRVEAEGDRAVLDAWNGGSWPVVLRFPKESPLPLSPGKRVRWFLPLPRRGAAAKGKGWSGDSEKVDLRFVLSIGGRELPLRLGALRPPVPGIRLRPEPGPSFLVPARGGEFPLVLLATKPRGLALRAKLAMIGPLGLRFGPEFGPIGPVEIRMPGGLDSRLLGLRLSVPPARAAGSPPWIARFELRDPDGGALAACRAAFHPIRIRIPEGLRLGIVRGPDRTVEESLRSLGVAVRALDARSLVREELRSLRTILVDSRALLWRPDLRRQVPRLLDFVANGGRLVVLYHKDREFNRESIGVRLAPYPLKLGRERVTREDAPVRILKPRHPLLNHPNRIRPSDWDGWVQDRGLYFPEMGSYDSRYEECLEIRELAVPEIPAFRDAKEGEDFRPQRGALLFARYGKGSYVYCALVLHRQLFVLHPGAARLLVNLVTPPR